MTMFLGSYVHPVDDTWTPPVHLATARECYRYGALHQSWVPAMRIMDTDDCAVVHMRDHVRRIPIPDGTFQEMPLTPVLVEVINAVPDEDAPPA